MNIAVNPSCCNCSDDGCVGTECCSAVGHCLCDPETIPESVTLLPSGIVGNCSPINGKAITLNRSSSYSCGYQGSATYESENPAGEFTLNFTFSFDCRGAILSYNDGNSGIYSKSGSCEIVFGGECGANVSEGNCGAIAVTFLEDSLTFMQCGCYTDSTFSGIACSCPSCMQDARWDVFA
jgi:hypothetical protein